MSDPLKVPKTMQPVFAEVSQRIDEFCSKDAAGASGRSLPVGSDSFCAS